MGRGGGTGLRAMLGPFICAFGGGTGWRSPPPPPPPPGPGVARNTSRTSVSARCSAGAAAPRVARKTRQPRTVAWIAPEAASPRPGDRTPAAGGRNSSAASSGGVAPCRIRTARTASLAATKCPSTVPIVPAAMSAAAWLVRAPAARAISRAEKTSGTAVMTEDMGSCPSPSAKRLPTIRTTEGSLRPFFRPIFLRSVEEPAAGLCSRRDTRVREGDSR